MKRLEYQLGFTITSKWLTSLYIDKEYSLPDFKQEFNLAYTSTQFLLDHFNIPKRTMQEAASTNKTRIQYSETCRTKYGVDNVSKSTKVKAKKAATFVLNYGVTNIFATKEFKDWLPGRMNELYGKGSTPNRFGNMTKWWAEQSDEYCKKHMIPAHEGYSNMWASLSEQERAALIQKKMQPMTEGWQSKLEDRIAFGLSSINIAHQRQHWVAQRSFDFILTGTRYLIEVQGDFWHANPKRYSDTDTLNHRGGAVTAGSLWERDVCKKSIANKYGYHIIYLWESDVTHLNDAQLVEYLKVLIESRCT